MWVFVTMSRVRTEEYCREGGRIMEKFICGCVCTTLLYPCAHCVHPAALSCSYLFFLQFFFRQHSKSWRYWRLRTQKGDHQYLPSQSFISIYYPWRHVVNTPQLFLLTYLHLEDELCASLTSPLYSKTAIMYFASFSYKHFILIAILIDRLGMGKHSSRHER